MSTKKEIKYSPTCEVPTYDSDRKEIYNFINEWKHRLTSDHINYLRIQMTIHQKIRLILLEANPHTLITARFEADNSAGMRCEFDIYF